MMQATFTIKKIISVNSALMIKILLQTIILFFCIQYTLFSQVEILKDINPGTASGAETGQSTFDAFKLINNKVFFRATSATTGSEIWSTDGTEAGTQILNDINPGVPGGGMAPIFRLGDKLIFAGYNSTYKTEPWVCDLDGNNASLLKNIGPPGVNDNGISGVFQAIVFQNKLFFAANNGVNGKELWVTDGTSAGTVLFMDILPGDENSSSEPRNFTIVGNELFFRASISIWKTDGTVPGTIQLMPINTSVTTDLVAFNDDLYFGAYDDAHGEELWKSNGAPSGTMILKDIETGIEPSFASNITAGEDLLYFTAQSGGLGVELWKSDGTESGTVMVKDVNPGANGMIPLYGTFQRFDLNGILYFAANNGVNGTEIWKSNGTTSGTSMIKDIRVSGSALPTGLKGHYDLVFFSANDGTHGTELWKTDGTEAGTVLMQDINPGSANAAPKNLTFIRDRLYLTATDPDFGTEVFYVDNPCFSDLQVVDADYHEGLGIGCDSAAIVEFSFESNDNYDTWTLSQPDILLLGYEGTWTAPKGQHIIVSIPAPIDPNFLWLFYAYPDEHVECTAIKDFSPVLTDGCNDEVAVNIKKRPTGLFSNNGKVGFKLTTSACAAVSGWTVVMTNILTYEEYGAAATSVDDSIFIDDLPVGGYIFSFTNYLCPLKIDYDQPIFLIQANDDCDRPNNLTPNPGEFTDPGTQTITGTSNSNIPSSCYNSSGAPQQSDLWYTMDIENTNSGIVSLGVVPEADGFDAAITVYKGNSCGSLTEVSGGCVNNFQGNMQEIVNIDPIELFNGELETRENVKLYIKVTDLNGTGGNFNFTLQGIPLPIDLLSFEASAYKYKEVQISWKVSNEINIKNYLVERTIEAKAWNTIGSVPSGNATNYDFIDKTPKIGINYYRLKIHEADGKTSLSGIKSVLLGNNNSLAVYPNPANDNVKILGCTETSNLVEIYNTNGSAVQTRFMSGSLMASNGLDISAIASGVYTIRITSQNKSQSVRFIKN